MKLYELYTLPKDDINAPMFGIPGNQPNKEENIEEILSNKGFVKLGNGLAGAVYGHPNLSYVLKIFINYFKAEGYLRYIKFIEENQDFAPYLPVFRGKMVKLGEGRNGGKLYAIRIEKLIPISNKDFMQIKRIFKDKNDNSKFKKLLIKLENTKGIDFEKENFMKRLNGDIVVTDPFFG